jgi:hypothetical protein
MIHVEHTIMKPGLRAVARRQDDDVIVRVSTLLSADEQRQAVREALRRARQAGWLPGQRHTGHLTLVPIALIGLWKWGRASPVHLAAIVAALAGTVATASVVAVAPGRPVSHGPVAPPSALHSPARHRRTPPPAHGGQTVPVILRGGSPHASAHRISGHPAPGRSATAAPATSPPRPSPSPSATAPQSSSPPAPSPTPSGSLGACVKVLGIRVCLGAGVAA